MLCARLVQLQVFEHDHYAAAARAELLGGETIYARRGAILDRNGGVLATSVDTWDIYVNRRLWPNDVTALAVATPLAEIINGDASAIRAAVAASDAVEVPVARDIDFETGQRVIEAGLTGVVLIPNTARVHPEGDAGASVVGFIGTDNEGLAGIEAAYNDVLQGEAGTRSLRTRHAGRPDPLRPLRGHGTTPRR